MTYTDLEGQEMFHPVHGHLTIIEHNHAGQVFCYDSTGRYVIIEGDDEALDQLEDVQFSPEEIAFIDFGEALLAEPAMKGIVIILDATNDLHVKSKNLHLEDLALVVQELHDSVFIKNIDDSLDN